MAIANQRYIDIPYHKCGDELCSKTLRSQKEIMGLMGIYLKAQKGNNGLLGPSDHFFVAVAETSFGTIADWVRGDGKGSEWHI